MISKGFEFLENGVYLCQPIHCCSHHLILQPDLPATPWTKNEDQRGSRTRPGAHSRGTELGFNLWFSPARFRQN